MINLVPPQAKRNIKIEYFSRLGIATASVVIILLIIILSLSLPRILLLQGQHYSIDSEHKLSIGENNTIDEYVASIKEMNSLVKDIKQLLPKDQVVTLLENIQSYESTAVKFESVSLQRVEDIVSSVSVTGVADTRQSLADLRERLLSDPNIAEVDLPIGNLAKDKNISFHLTVHLVAEEISS